VAGKAHDRAVGLRSRQGHRPIYYDKSYTWSGRDRRKPYALTQVEKKKRDWLASIAIRNKESLSRCGDGRHACARALHYPDEIREPE